MGKSGKRLILLMSRALISPIAYLTTRLWLSRPRTSGTLFLDCLEDEVEVIYDRAGIPHITASRLLDGFRALGFVTAQDRLVQMETMYRVASGRLSEVVGRLGST